MSRMTRSPYGLATIPVPSWWGRALCVGEDPQWWDFIGHPGRRGNQIGTANRQALAICRRCPVQAECHTDAGAAYPPTTGVIRAGLFWPLGST